MPLIDQIREEKLIELAKTRFVSDSTEDKLAVTEFKFLLAPESAPGHPSY
jgi:hypothetical protein